MSCGNNNSLYNHKRQVSLELNSNNNSLYNHKRQVSLTLNSNSNSLYNHKRQVSMKLKKPTYMQFYIAIADIGPYRLWLLPVTVK
jgi:hypothetical protein